MVLTLNVRYPIATTETHTDNDRELLSLLHQEDRQAFDLIFRKYWQELYDFAYIKTHDTDVAEEIVQELFVSFWEKRRTLQIGSLRSYLFVSVKNRVIDYYRRTTHDRLDTVTELASVDYPMFLDELEAAIQGAIAQLPEKTQKIFRMKKFEDKTTREISEYLAIPERTVEYHYTQATHTLKALLANFLSLLLGYFSSGTI
ncbi:RNA polymerase sigma-70 factor [Persicitalea jodogahamensis]|uniref:RNA polymerase sigma-70 factor n=1 Tax=Persicitalea jodogahamensis TaxID=402147 RepID=A0A8J3D513_9BACT|nr:RNA polymerase sigma-70 factor [Persicitalea jodogahamensis]GHB54299.1 RNA polymerase sigma-70 factor [Persicitalea jodogahamensis]